MSLPSSVLEVPLILSLLTQVKWMFNIVLGSLLTTYQDVFAVEICEPQPLKLFEKTEFSVELLRICLFTHAENSRRMLEMVQMVWARGGGVGGHTWLDASPFPQSDGLFWYRPTLSEALCLSTLCILLFICQTSTGLLTADTHEANLEFGPGSQQDQIRARIYRHLTSYIDLLLIKSNPDKLWITEHVWEERAMQIFRLAPGLRKRFIWS